MRVDQTGVLDLLTNQKIEFILPEDVDYQYQIGSGNGGIVKLAYHKKTQVSPGRQDHQRARQGEAASAVQRAQNDKGLRQLAIPAQLLRCILSGGQRVPPARVYGRWQHRNPNQRPQLVAVAERLNSVNPARAGARNFTPGLPNSERPHIPPLAKELVASRPQAWQRADKHEWTRKDSRLRHLKRPLQ